MKIDGVIDIDGNNALRPFVYIMRYQPIHRVAHYIDEFRVRRRSGLGRGPDITQMLGQPKIIFRPEIFSRWYYLNVLR